MGGGEGLVTEDVDLEAARVALWGVGKGRRRGGRFRSRGLEIGDHWSVGRSM